MILLLGGTEDSRLIAEKLQESNYRFIVSVVTEYGKYLIESNGSNDIVCGALDEVGLVDLIEKKNITTVIDATHPFAAVITNTTAAICSTKEIGYYRYERPELKNLSGQSLATATNFIEAVKVAKNMPGPWLFATGSKQLAEIIEAKFSPLEDLFVRVLPDPQVINKCYQMGLVARNIIAMQGPFSYDLNRAIYMQLGIKTMVTKDSGDTGGTAAKIEAALALGLNVVVIKRPQNQLASNSIFYSINELLCKLKGDYEK
ncbi:MAG: precorrin-6A reductase [Bacillota bacterium]|nr:precorrin-6A reductase [Bacillota bacterium]